MKATKSQKGMLKLGLQEGKEQGTQLLYGLSTMKCRCHPHILHNKESSVSCFFSGMFFSVVCKEGYNSLRCFAIACCLGLTSLLGLMVIPFYTKEAFRV